MVRTTISATLFSLLTACAPIIGWMIKEFLPGKQDNQTMSELPLVETGGTEISYLVLEKDTLEPPFAFVEQMPSFPGGQEAMYKYIYGSLQYPPIAKANKIKGNVVVQFVVSKEGEIQNAKVVSGIGGGCDEEALRLVNSMPRWNPGTHNGRAVPVTFNIPIKFVLK